MPAKSSEKEEMLNALVRRMYLVSCFIYLLTLKMGTEQTYIRGYVGRYHIWHCYWSTSWSHEGKIHLQDMSYEVQNSSLRFHRLIRADPLFFFLPRCGSGELTLLPTKWGYWRDEQLMCYSPMLLEGQEAHKHRVQDRVRERIHLPQRQVLQCHPNKKSIELILTLSSW